jgi:hypothetical protein
MFYPLQFKHTESSSSDTFLTDSSVSASVLSIAVVTDLEIDTCAAVVAAFDLR